MANLTNEEKMLLRSVEKGEWRSIPHLKTEIKRYQKMAKSSLKKDARVNIRIPESDLEGMRRRAFEEGLPYQTLMASVIHKYVTGRLIDKVSLR